MESKSGFISETRKSEKDRGTTEKRSLDSIRIFVSGGDTYYPQWIENRELVTNIKDADLVFFIGGADINAGLYDQTEGKFTCSNPKTDERDVENFETAIELGIPVLGICRGSQLACVMAGGKLIQHVTNHGKPHFCVDNTGHKFVLNSTHHQMLYPFDLPFANYNIIAWTSPSISTTYLNGNNKELMLPKKFVETEICEFPKIKTLGIQCHPESLREGSEGLIIVREIFDQWYQKHKSQK